MSDDKLILYPTNPFASIDNRNNFLNYLEGIGFIGETFQYFGETHHKPGTKFYEFIEFLNNWTAIILEDTGQGLEEVRREPNRLHCQIELTKVSSEPEIIASVYSLDPKCPFCGYEAKWDFVNEWYYNKAHFRWICPNCTRDALIYDLDWGGATGFARYFIEIWNIHFDEAVPSERLMKALMQYSGEVWAWFYYRI